MSSTAFRARGKVGKILSFFKNLTARPYHVGVPEIAYPIPCKEPKWCTAEEAMHVLESDMVVYSHAAAATPNELLNAMTERGKTCKLKNIKVIHMHTEGPANYAQKDCEGIFRSVSVFMGKNVRKAVAEGRSDTIPIFLHEIPKLFIRGVIKPDIALIHVSPPDDHGYCSLGTSVDCARAGCTYAKYIIAQVNPNMPRTFGESAIHMSHIDYAVCVDTPLPEHPMKPLNEVEKKIGKLIAENLIENGATLQMGIGAIPDAVLAQLYNHKDLGIHSEMFAGGVVELVEKGCINNHMKPTHQGRTVGSFILGPKELYDWVNNNPAVEMCGVDYVNNVAVISQMPKMTAINSAIEVDLTGQVCSDSIGNRFYSGFGGQVDFIFGAGQGRDNKGMPIIAIPSIAKNVFYRVDYVNEVTVIATMPKMTAINSCLSVDLTGQVNADSIGTRLYSGFGGQVDFLRGAAMGKDARGKPILAMPSITKRGESKIVPLLKEGAGVVTTRAHVWYVVTEYGIASLFGKTIRQRAYELIQIAHPKHREALEKAAFERLKTKPSPKF